MAHTTHPDHEHTHGKQCGHTAVQHDGHVDYLHDGHLHSVHGDHIDEHALDAAPASSDCGSHACDAHPSEHKHGDACGHEPVPHGDHTDYLVDAHLHHAHETHCDTHGDVALA